MAVVYKSYSFDAYDDISVDHTLTDKEADRVQRQILGKLSHVLGATLRG